MNKDIYSRSIEESELNEVSAGRNVNPPSESVIPEIIAGSKSFDNHTAEAENIFAPTVIKMPKIK